MFKLKPKYVKIIKTNNLYLCALLTGMCMAMTGPTLLDLQSIVNTDTQHIAFVYTARSTGYFFGSIFGGILFDMTNKKQLIFTVFNMLNAWTTVAIPWSKTIEALTGFMAVNGFTMGLLDTGTNVCCLNLWGKDSGPYYQALHFVWGIGGFISPLIAAPFLSKSQITNTTLTNDSAPMTNMTGVEMPLLDVPLFPSNDLHPITYAYMIVGGFGFFVSICFLFVCITSPIDQNGQKEKDSKTRSSGFCFIFVVVFLNFLLLFVETGTEIGFAQMVTTFAVIGPLKLTKTVGSYITSTYWAALTLFRFISVFLAIKFSNRTLVVLDIIVTTLGAVVLLCFASTYEWALWLSSALLGGGVASLFPSAIAWIDQYITVTNKILSLFASGSALGEMLIPYTISYFINEIPEVLTYVVLASCVLSAVLVFMMYLVLINKVERHVTNDEVQNSSSQVPATELPDVTRY